MQLSWRFHKMGLVGWVGGELVLSHDLSWWLRTNGSWQGGCSRLLHRETTASPNRVTHSETHAHDRVLFDTSSGQCVVRDTTAFAMTANESYGYVWHHTSPFMENAKGMVKFTFLWNTRDSRLVERCSSMSVWKFRAPITQFLLIWRGQLEHFARSLASFVPLCS